MTTQPSRARTEKRTLVNHSEIVSFLWGVADLIRDTFKRGKYQDVILPLTVLRRLDCVLRRHQGEGARASRPSCKGKKLENLDPQLRKVVRLRLLQHLPLRLREAPGRRAAPRREPAQLHRRLQPEHARGAGEVRLRQHHQQARRGGAALPGAGALQERRPAPGQDRQPDDGHDLRGADPEVQRGAERESRRALHAARRRAPDGGPDARRRRDRDPRQEGDPHRLRPVLRLRRHADDHQGAHHRRPAEERRSAPARDQQGRRDPSLRPGGEPRDLGRLEVRPVHEGPDRPRRRQHRVRQHALQRPPRRQDVRLPDRQSALREGLEARRGRRARRARARRRRPLLRRGSRGSATASSSSCCTCSRTPRSRRKAARASPSS